MTGRRRRRRLYYGTSVGVTECRVHHLCRGDLQYKGKEGERREEREAVGALNKRQGERRKRP